MSTPDIKLSLNWAARFFGIALLGVVVWIAQKYIAKVDAMEERVNKDTSLLEQVRDDVRWLKDNWGKR